MVQEIPGIVTIEQATDIRQLLTPDGVKARFAPFITGRVVDERNGEFFGKKVVVDEMLERLRDTGMVVVEGAHRSGKSSLLRTVGDRLTQDRVVQTSVHYDLQSNYNRTPEEVVEDIQAYIAYHSPGIKTKGASAIISLDEIEAYDKKNQIELLESVDTLRAQGYKVALAVIGDLHGDSPEELPRATKDKLLSMVGESIVVNRLLDESEMRELLSHGNKPIFTEILTRYLITEAGGHPYLGNALADRVFALLKFNEIEPGKLTEELRTEIRNMRVLDNFGVVVDKIAAAGFDPLTWEWRGEGQQPNVEVYRNMLPRFTSNIFRNWLSDYLSKHSKIS